MRRNETLAETLDELQGLDRVARAGYLVRGVADPESVSEHSWHVGLLVWALGDRVSGLDLERAIVLALLHDVAEVRVGDIPRAAARYFAAGAKKEAERAAAAEILAPLGERAESAMREALEGASLEARFVKACDRLQLEIKAAHYERHGARSMSELRSAPDGFDDGGFEPVREVFDQLNEPRAR